MTKTKTHPTVNIPASAQAIRDKIEGLIQGLNPGGEAPSLPVVSEDLEGISEDLRVLGLMATGKKPVTDLTAVVRDDLATLLLWATAAMEALQSLREDGYLEDYPGTPEIEDGLRTTLTAFPKAMIRHGLPEVEPTEGPRAPFNVAISETLPGDRFPSAKDMPGTIRATQEEGDAGTLVTLQTRIPEDLEDPDCLDDITEIRLTPQDAIRLGGDLRILGLLSEGEGDRLEASSTETQARASIPVDGSSTSVPVEPEG